MRAVSPLAFTRSGSDKGYANNASRTWKTAKTKIACRRSEAGRGRPVQVANKIDTRLIWWIKDKQINNGAIVSNLDLHYREHLIQLISVQTTTHTHTNTNTHAQRKKRLVHEVTSYYSEIDQNIQHQSSSKQNIWVVNYPLAVWFGRDRPNNEQTEIPAARFQHSPWDHILLESQNHHKHQHSRHRQHHRYRYYDIRSW